jgi:hypothetical protein
VPFRGADTPNWIESRAMRMQLVAGYLHEEGLKGARGDYFWTPPIRCTCLRADTTASFGWPVRSRICVCRMLSGVSISARRYVIDPRQQDCRPMGGARSLKRLRDKRAGGAARSDVSVSGF